MKAELFPFQKRALSELRMKSAEAVYRYERTHSKQVVSFTAPTGAGKTIIMAALIESILFGDEVYPEQPEAIIVWLSDSPQLNEQSKDKIDLKADKIRLGQCVTVQDDSFDQEVFDDGHIYFLNTQKLGKSSNLTKHTDNRQFTIWETLANTARDKSDHLYFIIDEAHRGMQGREAGRATTIMQKFLKGSPSDGIEAMPVVIGMSATSARFNALVQGIASDTQYVVVTTDEVRASGLLKDRIVISYPEENSGNKDMAVLQAAADEWKDKWDHWYQYCYEQHYAYVNPVLVIQVQNATGSSISSTNLDDCLQKIEERVNMRFQEGEVVHTFGDTTGSLQINGLSVPYIAPSAIAEDKRIKVVFFKESLSTGWDCPRAETMMSFRHANDATYIAQLLGRMIRTPLQMHILVDETLNDVHLYLPYFDAKTVKKIADELQNAEGGDIPADIYGEAIGKSEMDVLTVSPPRSRPRTTPGVKPVPGQISMFDNYQNDEDTQAGESSVDKPVISPQNDSHDTPKVVVPRPVTTPKTPAKGSADNTPVSQIETDNVDYIESPFDREAVVKAINDSGLLTYDVRTTRIHNNYLTSMFSLARLLTQSGKYPDATDDVLEEIVKRIREYITSLKRSSEYKSKAEQLMEFQMTSQVFDAFGETVDVQTIYHFISSTDTDIERQFRRAETKLGNEGVGKRYGRYYYDDENPNEFKIDVILYAMDDDCYRGLLSFAEATFHQLNDDYRRKIVNLGDKYIKQYDDIVSNGDIVSKHNFRLPETITVPHESSGKDYQDHLFVSNETGVARIKLNVWEEGVLEEEQARPDYVCWLRNPPRSSWSLCIPYEMSGETKRHFPDFLVVRKDDEDEFVFDILEPHDSSRKDNLGKAKGFAEYAKQNPGVGRIQLIRVAKDDLGHNRFKRLDMGKSAVRDKVSNAINNDELDHIFDTDGFFMDT